MPKYSLHHVHHETRDVTAAVAFYQNVFGAAAAAPYERAGATWVHVTLGDVQITVTNRPAADMPLGRYQGFDHIALATDDFDATLESIRKHGATIWTGPLTMDNGQRLVFVSGPDHAKIEVLEKS